MTRNQDAGKPDGAKHISMELTADGAKVTNLRLQGNRLILTIEAELEESLLRADTGSMPSTMENADIGISGNGMTFSPDGPATGAWDKDDFEKPASRPVPTAPSLNADIDPMPLPAHAPQEQRTVTEHLAAPSIELGGGDPFSPDTPSLVNREPVPSRDLPAPATFEEAISQSDDLAMRMPPLAADPAPAISIGFDPEPAPPAALEPPPAPGLSLEPAPVPAPPPAPAFSSAPSLSLGDVDSGELLPTEPAPTAPGLSLEPAAPALGIDGPALQPQASISIEQPAFSPSPSPAPASAPSLSIGDAAPSAPIAAEPAPSLSLGAEFKPNPTIDKIARDKAEAERQERVSASSNLAGLGLASSPEPSPTLEKARSTQADAQRQARVEAADLGGLGFAPQPETAEVSPTPPPAAAPAPGASLSISDEPFAPTPPAAELRLDSFEAAEPAAPLFLGDDPAAGGAAPEPAGPKTLSPMGQLAELDDAAPPMSGGAGTISLDDSPLSDAPGWGLGAGASEPVGETPKPLTETWNADDMATLKTAGEESSAIGGERHGEPQPSLSFGLEPESPAPAAPPPAPEPRAVEQSAPAPAPEPPAPEPEPKKSPESGATTVLIRYTCPKCKTQGMQAVDKVGTVVNCSNCGKPMRLVMKK